MKKCLLDSSFVIDLLNEIASEKADGPALRWLNSNKRAQCWISPVTLAEVLEGAEDPEAVGIDLARFRWQGIHRNHARRVALVQRSAPRPLGENDAWQAALADSMKATLVGSDKAFARVGIEYEDHRGRPT